MLTNIRFLTQSANSYDYPDEKTVITYITKRSQENNFFNGRLYAFTKETLGSVDQWQSLNNRLIQLKKKLPQFDWLGKTALEIEHKIYQEREKYYQRLEALEFVKEHIVAALHNATLDYLRHIMESTQNAPRKRKSKIEELNCYLGCFFQVNPETGKIISATCHCDEKCECMCKLSMDMSIDAQEKYINIMIQKIIDNTPALCGSTKLDKIMERLDKEKPIIEAALRKHFGDNQIINIYDDSHEALFYKKNNQIKLNIKKLDEPNRLVINSCIPLGHTRNYLDEQINETAQFAIKLNEAALFQLENFINSDQLRYLFDELKKSIQSSIDNAGLLKIKAFSLSTLDSTRLRVECIETAYQLEVLRLNAQKTINELETTSEIKIKNKFQQTKNHIDLKLEAIKEALNILQKNEIMQSLFPKDYSKIIEKLNTEKNALRWTGIAINHKLLETIEKNHTDIAQHIKEYNKITDDMKQIQDSLQDYRLAMDHFQTASNLYSQKMNKLHKTLQTEFQNVVYNELITQQSSLENASDIINTVFNYYYENKQPETKPDLQIDQPDNLEQQLLKQIISHCENYQLYLKTLENYDEEEKISLSLELNAAPIKIELAHKIKAVSILLEEAAHGTDLFLAQHIIHDVFLSIQNMISVGVVGEILRSHRSRITEIFSCCFPQSFFAPNSLSKLIIPIEEAIKNAPA